jgi:VWFA-related protein
MLAACAVMTGFGTPRPSAQSRSPSEPPTVDILAVANDGRSVRDLKPDELTVRMDGKARGVRSLQYVPASDPPAGSGRPGAVELPAPFETNAAGRTGRDIMIVIDDESLRVGDERRTKEALNQVMAELPPSDRVAIATVPHGGIKLDFTSDRGRVQQALAPIVGQAQVPASMQEAACQTRTVLEQLVGTLATLNGNSTPTTFIFLTTGLVGPRSDTIRAGRTVGQCELTADHFQNVARAADEARAQFYVVQAEHAGGGAVDPTALFGGNTNPMVGLENLAGVTGTQVLRLASTDNVLSRIVRETAGYYQMTFEVEPSERNNSAHRLEVKVSRPGVTIRVRPSVTIAKADTAATKASAKTPRETLRDSKAYRDLPIRATSFFSRNASDPNKRLMVVAAIEPIDPSIKPTSVVAGLYDRAGKLIAEWVSKPEELASLPVKAAMLAPAGTYRLRAAAGDAGGRIGAVDSEVVVELPWAGPMNLSSLVLGVQNAAGALSPKLEFGSGDPNAMVFFELYGGRANMQLGAVVELAETANGPALLTAQPRWSATSEPDRFNATAQIPMGSLAPGDYIVRAIVGVEGRPEGRIMRTLRKK